MRYYLGLGSNLGDQEANLRRARARLKKKDFKILAASCLYRSEPMGLADQPWYLNQVIEVEAKRTPLELLNAVKEIEKLMKRRPSVRNGPRIIDIDILLAEDTVIRTEVLTVPHPRLAERNFVLAPLAEIAPGAVHPVLKKTISQLRHSSKDLSRVMIWRSS
jgi:2-amino-4-hydroxy-6-hydroxymethyldihydropteridine diphosphokinase